jgi:hypothetical protein
MKVFQLKVISAAITLALAAGSAQAVLERTGPASTAPSVGGFPSWYLDTSGLAIEFCDPKNAAEVAGGWCLLLPANVPVAPEVFPTSFFDEHFYTAATSTMTAANGGKALLVAAVEAAFATGPVIPGKQVTFSRIRVRLLNLPVTGDYRFITPYSDDVFSGVAGGQIFNTDDVGINCLPGTFDCALDSRLGPFLLPSATPGGPEIAAIAGPAPGKLYISDPARSGPVTGSSLPSFTDSSGALRNHNMFRIEGPVGSNLGGVGVDFIETANFALVGRVFSGALASRVDVDRATYTRSSTGMKVDVFASGFPTAQPRLPTQVRLPLAAPQLTFFGAPCVGVPDALGTLRAPFSAPIGVPETQMFATAARHWGQIQPAVLPTTVCVKNSTVRDINGALVPAYVPQKVTDEVTVTSAQYDPVTGTLAVAATSSDTLIAPTLSLAYDGFRTDLLAGAIAVPGLVAPPSKVRVLSSASGETEYMLHTGFETGGAPTPLIPVALNDSFTFAEDSGVQTFDLLGNDANALGATVTITSPPGLGTAVVNPNGTVTFTPRLNASGLDAFIYTATVAGQVSNAANVSLNITPVNDAPTAVNDSAAAVTTVPVAINVLANDTDPDGLADIVAAVNLTAPVGNLGQAGATATVAGGIVTFKALVAGTYTFTYKARDVALATSLNTATVTVTVAAEALNVTLADYTRAKSLLRTTGTLTPVVNQTVKLEFVNAAGTVLGLVGTVTPDALGAWATNFTLPLPVNATSLKGTTSNGKVFTRALIIR